MRHPRSGNKMIAHTFVTIQSWGEGILRHVDRFGHVNLVCEVAHDQQLIGALCADCNMVWQLPMAVLNAARTDKEKHIRKCMMTREGRRLVLDYIIQKGLQRHTTDKAPDPNNYWAKLTGADRF